MRASERIAVVAVTLMVLPAFLAPPALGVWLIVRVWPGLTTMQHVCFWLSLTLLGFTLPHVFRDRLDLVWLGRTRKLSLFEQALILIPFSVGTWAVTGSWIAVFAILYWKVWLFLQRLKDAAEGRTEVVDVTKLSEPEDVELPIAARLTGWIRRRRARARPRPIAMGPQRGRSRRVRER